MSLGGNLSSGYTDTLIDKSQQCSIVKAQASSYSTTCSPITLPATQPVARYPSMVLFKKECPPPSPADFAKYPKVAVPSSIRTAALANGSRCSSILDPSKRFSQFQRYQVPVPCAPLPASANMAGISKPSSRACNL